MNKTAHYLLFISLLAGMVSAAYGLHYMYLSEYETTVFGDRVRFWHGDTCSGPVHSNSQIAMGSDPVFYDIVTQSGEWNDFDCSFPGFCDAVFLGPPPIFHAIPVLIPDSLTYYRQAATRYFDPGADQQMRVRIDGSMMKVWMWNLGESFDETVASATFVLGSSHEIVFTETPLELMAFDVIGDVVIASAQSIRLLDDARVAGPTSGPPEFRVAMDNPNFLEIASEGDIVVADTRANGQCNCGGPGPEGQPSQAFKDIVITAALSALGRIETGTEGSFTFEHQNDPDSAVEDCYPDERGIVYLYGAITQRRRGYLHRSNHGGTGYAKQIRWDERLRNRPDMVTSYMEVQTTDTLDFGNVPLDTAVWDTAEIYVTEFSAIGMVSAPQPFHAVQIPPYYGHHFRVPVSFHPESAGSVWSILQVLTSYDVFQIPIHGHGVYDGKPHVTGPQAYPNPFNASTVFSFSILQAGKVRLDLFDITGRLVMTLFDQHVEPGTQRVMVSGESLSSGIYFARLATPDQVKTVKMMLVK